MTDCKYWKESWGKSFAGRCSAPDDVKTNAVNKWCKTPRTCPFLLNQMNNQEILDSLNEKIKAAEEALLYLNQTKSDIERVIANSKKSPVEEAFKENYGVYPDKLASDADFNSWKSFKRGYEAAYRRLSALYGELYS